MSDAMDAGMSEKDVMQIEDLAKNCKELIDFLKSSKAEGALRGVQGKLKEFHQHQLCTKKTTTELLNDLVQSERVSGQKLLELDQQNNQMMEEIQRMEQEVQRNQSKSQILDSELEFLQKELERLRDAEQEIQTLQQEVNEDTTEIIPSNIYVSQLYFKVTKMKLEVDMEPHVLRGVHYGADVAAPIDIDTSSRSPCEVSDQLWSLVNAEW